MKNDWNDFWKLSQREQQSVLFVPMLRILRDNGGELDNKVLKNLLPSYDARFDLDTVINRVIQTKSGTSDVRFNWPFNWARKNLIFAGFVEYQNHVWKLTAKGLTQDLKNFDPARDIFPLTAPKWKEKGEQNKAKRTSSGKSENEDAAGDETLEDEIIDKLRKMDPVKFESFSRGLLQKMGVTMSTELGIKPSGDGGIDGYGYYKSNDYKTTKVAIQCKRYKNGNVGSKDIDALRGAVSKFGAEYGIFITTAYFSKAAEESAIGGNIPYITLIDADELVALMKKYEYYVKRIEQYVIDERLNEF